MFPLSKGTFAPLVWLILVSPVFGWAQALELIPLDHLWRYEQSGADLGTAWRATTYDDSAWPQGRGVLAAEDNPFVRPLTNTVLTRIGTNGQYKLIDYFRTRFYLPEVRPGYFLMASNLVDDGAVVYLNGAELFRVRMPAGPVFANTLASETIDVGREGVFVTTNLLPANLQQGENVLAVEVHQPYTTSSDVTWGMVLTYAPLEPLRIVIEPQDQTVAEGNSGALTATVRGTLPRFQWWKDGQPLPGQTNARLSLVSVSRNDAGQYFVTVTNEVSSVTSRVATLTVALDRTAPRLEFASWSLDGIYTAFSEILDPESSSNIENYRIVSANGDQVPITSVYYGLSSVWLTAAEMTPGVNHYLFVSNVRDRPGNTIAPNSGMTIQTLLTNLPIDSVWKYDDSGLAPDPAWREHGFDDSQWPAGAALLYNDANLSLQPPAVRNTLIAVTNSSGSFVTHYFRLHFTNGISPFGSRFDLSYYVDDGVALYLNGREIARFNLPAGPLSYTTRASSSATEGAFNAGAVVSSANFLPGHNVLAAEVHQYSLASPNYPDISFAVQGRAYAASFANTAAVILQEPEDLIVAEGGVAIFNAVIAAADTGQWLWEGAPIPGAVGMSYTNGPALSLDSGAGLALVVSNSFGMVTSRTARLTVIADLTPPRLLSADMGTNVDRVLLSFSEALNLATVAPENFAITNDLGESLQILNAYVANETNVVLETAPRIAGRRYVVVANDIMDLSDNGNMIASNSVVGISYEELLVMYTSIWKYDESGTNYFSNAWRDPLFDDSHWPSGPGLLGFEESYVLPLPILTMLTPPEFRGPTYFFRTLFNFSGDPTTVELRLRHIVDDGVVLFLNGQEVHRARVPIGQNATTTTDNAVQDGTIEGPFTISSAALVNGVNVLAAEVHQFTTTSADVVFGLELVRAFPANPRGPMGPSLKYELRNNQLTLSWDAFDFILESAEKLSGPWSPAPQPTIPYTVTFENPARFFRLRNGSF